MGTIIRVSPANWTTDRSFDCHSARRAWHDSYVPVLMLVVAGVILAGVVAVAAGRGGEMGVPEPNYPPIGLGPVSAADVALLRPPSAAWGYNMRVTDEALEVIARAVTERDVQIAALQQQVSDLRGQLGSGAWPAEAGSSKSPEAAAGLGA